MLVIVAVVFFVSALGQVVAQAYSGDESITATAVFSVTGSLLLTTAIVIAARRHDRADNAGTPSGVATPTDVAHGQGG